MLTGNRASPPHSQHIRLWRGEVPGMRDDRDSIPASQCWKPSLGGFKGVLNGITMGGMEAYEGVGSSL